VHDTGVTGVQEASLIRHETDEKSETDRNDENRNDLSEKSNSETGKGGGSLPREKPTKEGRKQACFSRDGPKHT